MNLRMDMTPHRVPWAAVERGYAVNDGCGGVDGWVIHSHHCRPVQSYWDSTSLSRCYDLVYRTWWWWMWIPFESPSKYGPSDVHRRYHHDPLQYDRRHPDHRRRRRRLHRSLVKRVFDSPQWLEEFANATDYYIPAAIILRLIFHIRMIYSNLRLPSMMHPAFLLMRVTYIVALVTYFRLGYPSYHNRESSAQSLACI